MITKQDYALYAAKHVKQWGIFAASRYAKNRGVSAETLIKAIKRKIQ